MILAFAGILALGALVSAGLISALWRVHNVPRRTRLRLACFIGFAVTGGSALIYMIIGAPLLVALL